MGPIQIFQILGFFFFLLKLSSRSLSIVETQVLSIQAYNWKFIELFFNLTNMGRMWASPFGLAQIGPIWDPYRFSLVQFSHRKSALMVYYLIMVGNNSPFQRIIAKKSSNSVFCKWAKYMGPMWALSGQAHVGQPIWGHCGSLMGQPIWACPDAAHMGQPIYIPHMKSYITYMVISQL